MDDGQAALGTSPDRRWKPLRRLRTAASRALAGVTVAALALTGAAPPADAAGVRIIRDAEIEALIQDYAEPIFRAAGIRSSSVEIFLIPNPTFNAFVASGQKMFIHTGALLTTETPNEMIGVIAHEAAHIAGGHQVRIRQVIENTRIASLIAGLVGMGAMVGAAASGGGGNLVGAGGGLLAGIGEAGRRNILAYARAEEQTADRAAVTYLEKAGQSPAGMLTTFRRMASDQLFAAQRADPYVQSHPMARERVAQAERLVAASRFRDRKDPPALQLRHDLARAKLSAFTEDPQRVGRRYPASDASLPARYARAIVSYRHGRIESAVKAIDGIIASDPGNPYFWELKGQALLERGRPRDALEPLRKAVSLEPSSALLRILLGHALVETGDKRLVDEAIKHLTVGVQRSPDAGNGYRQLGRAYAMKGDIGMAQLANAQELFADGKVGEAKQQAARAQAKLKRGTSGWLRADDIVAYKPPVAR